MAKLWNAVKNVVFDMGLVVHVIKSHFLFLITAVFKDFVQI